jgi:hypothetical protein
MGQNEQDGFKANTILALIVEKAVETTNIQIDPDHN